MAGEHSQTNQSDIWDFLAPFVLFGVLMMLLGMLWEMKQTVIIDALFTTVWGISQGAQYVSFLYPERIADNLANWAVTLDSADPRRYGASAAIMMADTVAHTAMFVLMPWMLWRLWEIRKAYRVNRFARKFDLYRLAQVNMVNNPGLKAAVEENLIDKPLHQGPWAMNRSPIDWALENRMVYTVTSQRMVERIGEMLGASQNNGLQEKRRYIKGWNEKKMHWTVAERRRVMPSPWACRLDKDATDDAMERQLGGFWDGFERLDRFERCVAALFLIGIAEGFEPARKLALQMGNSFKRCDRKGRHRPTLDDSGVDKAISKHKNHPAVRRVLHRHGYKNTVMVGLLNELTQKGIFIANEFLWLKCVNRTLFFALLQYGGDRPYTEAAGVFSHYQEEARAGHAIHVPCVAAATDSIERDLYEEEWIPNENGELKNEYEERLSIEDAKRAQGDAPNAG